MLTTTQTLELAAHLRLVVGRLARRLRQQSLGGLTPSQRSVLATLGTYGPITLGHLAEIEGISRPSVSGITQRLCERGLIERSRHPHDARSSMVRLRKVGTEALEESRRERTAFLAERLSGLSSSDQRTLAEAVEILDRLVDGE